MKTKKIIYMKKSEKSEIGNRIREARKLRNLTLQDLAYYLQTTVDTVWRWEKGLSSPKGYALSKIAEVLGVNPNWLATGEGPMEAEESKLVPVYGTVHCGSKGPIWDEPIRYVEMQDLPPNSFVVLASGDSLEPLIFEGDYVIISKIPGYTKKSIYFLAFDDGDFIFRIVEIKEKEQVAILSTLKPNKYPTEVIPLKKLRFLYPILEIRRKNIDDVLKKL